MKMPKHYLKYFLVFTIVAVFYTIARADIFDDLALAIKGGNSREIANYFNSSIELTTPSSEGFYSKSQAEIILKKFFENYPCNSFNIAHRGSSSAGSKYAIGNYNSNGNSFRVYIYMKDNGGKSILHELKFEKD